MDDIRRKVKRREQGRGQEVVGKAEESKDLITLAGNQAALQFLRGENEGLPPDLKAAAEAKAGLPMDDVLVHYRSSKPREVGALAYTKGNEIYLEAGQEKHLPHELGHVVQQKQGKVRATGTVGGQLINDDESLEREAETMF